MSPIDSSPDVFPVGSYRSESLPGESHSLSLDVETQQLPREAAQAQPGSTRPAASVGSPVSTPVDRTAAVAASSGQAVQLESFSAVSCNLSFSCLLIPRFSDHYLAGDITDCLATWMSEICISYGWRLDGIIVRPGYMHWIITVPPTANPAQFMRITRQQTSLHIFSDFPRFKQKNMSGDFWAPGYFVTSGNQPQPMENINAFILQTRHHQGIY